MIKQERLAAAAGAALITVAVLAVYAGTLGYGFIAGEDLPHLEYVDSLLQREGVSGLLTADYRQQPSIPLGYYRPVILATFAIEQALAGKPWLFHLSNVLVHLVNAWLVFWLLRLMVPGPLAATGGALLFALHPVHTECVAMVAGRTDLWTALFVLGATIPWARVRLGVSRHPAGERALSAAALALAVLSKESAMLTPVALLAWDLILPGGARGRARRNLPWLGAWGLALMACLALRLGVSGTGFGPGSTGIESAPIPGVTNSAWLGLGSLLTAWRLLVWPGSMNVAYLDGFVQPDAGAVAGAALLLGLALTASGAATGRVGLLALSWFGVFWLPVSKLVPLASYHIHERYLYIPAIGMALLAAGLVRRGLGGPRGRLATAAVLVAILAGSAALTMQRLPAWRSDEALWSRMVDDHPGSWVGHFYLARLRLQQGRPDEAAAGFRRTLELADNFAPAWMELGLAHSAAGRHRDCLDAMLAARRANPRLPWVNSNVAVAYRNLGLRREAARAFQEELQFHPRDPRVHYDLASELLASGDPAAALGAVDTSLALAPGAAEARLLRGLTLLHMNRRDEARGELQRLREMDPDAARRLEQAMAGRTGGGV